MAAAEWRRRRWPLTRILQYRALAISRHGRACEVYNGENYALSLD